MLTQIVSIGILKVLQLKPDGNISIIMVFVEEWLKKFLPDSSIRLSKSGKSASVREVCTYDPESSRMWIYRGDLNGKTIDILLELGKPVMLNHIQMAALDKLCFPFRL